MATEGGLPDTDVESADAVDEGASTLAAVQAALDAEPYRFDFFQAVRLLQRMAPDRHAVGQFVDPSEEAVRFTVNPSIAFPASQIQAISRPEDAPPHLSVNFMGLSGPLAVLPVFYTEKIIEQQRSKKDGALRDFFDIFHHRMLSLFYQAWQKYRFTVAYETGARDRFSHHLLDLMGLGTAGLANRQTVADDSLIYYAGLLAHAPRTAAALEQILKDYFEVPVEVEQFAGGWYRLDADTQCRLEQGNPASSQLGLGAVVGDEVWDQQSRLRVHLGPLSFEQYLDFLPTGSAYKPLASLLNFFGNRELDFDVRLILRRDEVPRCKLGVTDPSGPQLGWVTWIKSRPTALPQDAGDTILQIA